MMIIWLLQRTCWTVCLSICRCGCDFFIVRVPRIQEVCVRDLIFSTWSQSKIIFDFDPTRPQTCDAAFTYTNSKFTVKRTRASLISNDTMTCQTSLDTQIFLCATLFFVDSVRSRFRYLIINKHKNLTFKFIRFTFLFLFFHIYKNETHLIASALTTLRK